MDDKNVVKISVNANVAGVRLDVQEATITNGVNALPTVELSCAPSESRSSAALKPNVYKPSISDFDNLYRKLQRKAWGLKERCNIDIKISTDGSSSGQDSLSLKGWILTGVGMSSVSATSAPYLNVILQHPICLLTKVGSIYETVKSNQGWALNQATKGAKDIIDLFKRVYECVKKLEYWPAPNAYAAAYRNQLGDGDFDPSKYLKWKGGNGIFMAVGITSEIKERLAMAIARTILPNSDGSSTWDMLIRSSGSLLISITQDQGNNYTGNKLIVEPTQPWKTSAITIWDEDCFWTDLPGLDPYRLAGVMCRKMGSNTYSINQGLHRNGNPRIKPPDGEILYCPPPMQSPNPLADGRIMKVPVPSVLEAALRRDEVRGDNITAGMTSAKECLKTAYNDALSRYCQTVYEITAASMSQARMQMALKFKTENGDLILPGNTCKFVSGYEDIYYGYIRQVVHHMSTSGNCGTTVLMSHVRSTPNFVVNEAEAIPYGAKNHTYE